MSLNNKFAKYGVVLIAAITVATAVQAQNITTQYAYAEEVTANDPALNRMLYLDYSAPEDSTVGWLTGEVVTPTGYTVEPAYELEGFPYYTITGSDGKSYSAGDTITVEDPLVNHANPEDNVLYYRYYSVDPNASTSEAPAPSTSPSTSEAPAPSTSPSTSEAPAPSTSPSTSEAPAPSTSPSTSEAPAPSTSPSTSEAPAPSTSPSTSEAPAPSTSPSTSEAPAPSTSPSTSEAPAPSTSPSTSEAPAVEKPSQKTDDKTTATDKAKADKKADSKPAKTEKSKDANSKKAAATKDNSVANKAAEKSNATSAPTEQAKDTTAKTNNPDTGNSQSIVKEAAGTVDTAAVNHNDNNGFLALLGFVAAALIGLFQSKSKKEK